MAYSRPVRSTWRSARAWGIGRACRRCGRSSAISANGSSTGSPARPVTDPMSGFFMIRRDLASRLAPRLSPDGFKILVDVILSAGGNLKIVEAPYKFRKRLSGRIQADPSGRTRFSRARRPSCEWRRSAQPFRPVRPHWRDRPRCSHSRALRVPRGACRLGFPVRPSRRHARRNGEQLRPQQRDHLSDLPLSRPWHDWRLRGFRARMQRRRTRQHRRGVLGLQVEPDLVGRGPVGGRPERRLELRRQHDPHLASSPPRPMRRS